MLFTDKGKKILKKVDFSMEDLDFIYNASTYIKQSFPRVMEFNKTKEGSIFTRFKGEVYYVLDLVEGRECEFSNPIDVKLAAVGLAKLHNAGEGFRYDLKEKNMVGKAIDSFGRKMEELKFFKSLANIHDIKSEFDTIFLENVDEFINEVKGSQDILIEANYYKLCSQEDKIVICHHDLAHHNIIINDEDAYFIDFDYAIIDLKVHDLCNFINKAIKNYAYDIIRAKSIIEDYCTYNSLDLREKEVLYGFLMFPEDFYSISKDYYARRKYWDEEVFLERLNRKLEHKVERLEFLEEFKSYIRK